MNKAERKEAIKALKAMVDYSKKRPHREADTRNNYLVRLIELLEAGQTEITYDFFLNLYPPKREREEVLGNIRKIKSEDLKDFMDDFYISEEGRAFSKRIAFQNRSFKILFAENKNFCPSRIKPRKRVKKKCSNAQPENNTINHNLYFPSISLALSQLPGQLFRFWANLIETGPLSRNNPLRRSIINGTILLGGILLTALSVIVAKAFLKDFMRRFIEHPFWGWASECLPTLKQAEMDVDNLTSFAIISYVLLGIFIMSLFVFLAYKLVKGKAPFIKVLNCNLYFIAASLPFLVIGRIYFLNPFAYKPLMANLFLFIVSIIWFAYYARLMNKMMQVRHLVGSPVLILALILDLNITPYITIGGHNIQNKVPPACTAKLHKFKQNGFSTIPNLDESIKAQPPFFTQIN